MPRVTVWVNDELLEQVERERPGFNRSAAMTAGLRALIACDHAELTCTLCGEVVSAEAVAGPRLAAFWKALELRFITRIGKPGYEGAAAMVRGVAIEHAVPGVHESPVLRKSRAAHERQLDDEFHERQAAEVTALPLEADSRHRHPTARAQEATA